MGSRKKTKALPSPPTEEEDKAPQTAFQKNALKWDLEDGYEQQQARKRRKLGKDSIRLPILTQDGGIGKSILPEIESKDENAISGSDEEGDQSSVQSAGKSEQEEPELPESQQIRVAKEQLAKAAELIGESPEEHAPLFKQISQITDSEVAIIKKLGLVTQLAVYKDVIPGYRIRPLPEVVSGLKLSKEVKQLRNYEQALVKGYQAYVKELSTLSKQGRSRNASELEVSMGTVAIQCACDLLEAVPHFNFRGDLLSILVDVLKDQIQIDASFERCRKTIESLFRADDEGAVSREAVEILTKTMKSRHFNIDESVLNTFLQLRLLSELSIKAINARGGDRRQAVKFKGKTLRAKREFRTQKTRKMLKEKKAIESEMKEADATVSYEERERLQSETLKLVFATYFKILKAKSPKLMGAVLEGLAKYAHLINQDLFGDLLEALRELLGEAEIQNVESTNDGEEGEAEVVSRNVSRESLLCIVTAFALLEGQDVAKAASGLQLDLEFFTSHLYQSLYRLAMDTDIELSSKTLRLADPDNRRPFVSKSKVNMQTTAALLIRCLNPVLLPSYSTRSVPSVRLAAFSKQMSTMALQLPEKSCLATLGTLNRIVQTHRGKVTAMWNTEERRGDGIFNPTAPNLEGSNPFSATIWEGELLRFHFAPEVRDAVKVIQKSLTKSN